MYRTIEQELALHGCGLFRTEGDSMEPLLHHRQSTVAIAAAKGPLKRFDVALYRRPSGEYVLHRIVQVRRDAYLIRGDNRVWWEKVPKDWVIGVMTGYYEGASDRFISCGSGEYRHYVKKVKRRERKLRLRTLPGRIGKKLGILPRNAGAEGDAKGGERR